MIKWLIVTVIFLVSLAGIAALVGMLVPQGHTASREATVAGSVEDVWATINDFAAFPGWRTDVERVEGAPSNAGRTAWVEYSRTGRLPIEVIAADPPRRLVTRIADRDLPFGGTWTYELRPAPGGTTIRITEDGEVYNPVFRFMARFVFGYTATVEAYLKALGRKFGQDVDPVTVSERT